MRTAIDNFQKTIFTILLFVSSCSGIISNLAFSNNKQAFYVIFDGLILFLAVMSFSFIRAKLGLVLFFIIVCIGINFSYNGNSFYYSLNGIREILNILCLAIFFNHIFSDENEELAEEYVEIMKKFGTYFLVAQVPICVWQFSKFGPTDWVGGTYGYFGSGILTLAIICMVYFMSRFTRNLTQTVMLYACLLPLFLNETKISFILIPMMIGFIHFQPKLKSILLAGLGAGFFLFVFNSFYSNDFGTDFDNNLTGIFSKDFIDSYLFGDIYTYTDVPRFTKIILAGQMLWQNPANIFLFGFEYGVFRGGDEDLSHFAQSAQWLMTGTRPYLFYLMIQGGVMLTTGIIWLILHINKFFGRYNNKFKTFLFLLFIMILFYNDSLRNQNFAIIYFFMIYYANSTFYNSQLAEE